MKSTGIVRRMDGLDRIVIPKEICRTSGIHEGDSMEIFVHGNMIILRKHEPASDEILMNALYDVCRETGKNPQNYIEKAREAKS